MTRTARWLFVAALLPVAACSSSNTPVASAPPPPPALAPADMTFVNMAASGDAAEIGNAKLAQATSKRPAIKKFADQMITDHTATTNQLMTIAQSKGVTPDATPPDMAQQMMTKLQGEKGAKFDHDYAAGQVMSHQMMVQAFKDEIANGQDADLKAFAQQTLPTIQMHLKEAMRLSGRKA